MRTFLYLLLALVLTTQAHARGRGQYVALSEKNAKQIVGVRVWDVYKYIPEKLVPHLKPANAMILENPNQFLQRRGDKSSPRITKVWNLFFTDLPKETSESVLLDLAAFVETKNKRFYFKKISVKYQKKLRNNRVLMKTRILSTYSIKDTDFTVQTSLADRRSVWTDSRNGIKMVFPNGVGSFDTGVLHPGETSLLTPRFNAAYLSRYGSQEHRKKPTYFSGHPFIRIYRAESKKNDYRTSIGFHIQPNEGQFVRAFDSHGCMRMMKDDLYTAYYIVAYGPKTYTPIRVKYYIDDASEHPFKKRSKPFKKILNVGSKYRPDYKMDLDNLVQTTTDSNNEAPVSELVDDAADNYHNVFNYKMADHQKVKLEKHKKKCAEKYPFYDVLKEDKEKYNKCVRSFYPKLSFKDKLYRWKVHGDDLF